MCRKGDFNSSLTSHPTVGSEEFRILCWFLETNAGFENPERDFGNRCRFSETNAGFQNSARDFENSCWVSKTSDDLAKINVLIQIISVFIISVIRHRTLGIISMVYVGKMSRYQFAVKTSK